MTVSSDLDNHKNVHKLTLYHYEGWPDGNPPDGDAMDDLKKLIEKGAAHMKKNKGSPKFVVHCHAGLGRTGTTLALIMQWITVDEQKKQGVADPHISIWSIIRRLREQRECMVETLPQYKTQFNFCKTYFGK